MADARVGQQGTLTHLGRARHPPARALRYPLHVGLHLRRCLSRTCGDRRAGHAQRRHPGDERPPRQIARTVAEGAHAIPVLDGAGWHGAKALCVPDNITLLPLPPYAPELNPVENVWAYLRANRLAISVFETCEQIVTRCCEAWNFFANDTTAIRSITSRDYAKAVKSLGRWHYCWPCRPAARN